MVDLVSSEDRVAVNRLPINVSNSAPLSMEGQYNEPNDLEPPACTIDIDPPPSYDADAILQSPYSRRKFNIQPREDEGRETLPPYSSEISLENVFERKVELEGAIHRASDRNWYRVYATLQGTALTFHKSKSGYFSAWSSDSGKSDEVAEGKKGPFLKSYNLQHADVGIAADYFKKRFVIRVRAETDQFLLSCYRIETFVHWLQSLFAAIDIAPPLDTRSLPRDFSIPRVRRRRPIASTSITDLERNATLVREQYEIMQRQYPSLVEGPIPEGVELPSTDIPGIQRPATARAYTAPAQMLSSSPDVLTPAISQAHSLDRLQTYSTGTLYSSSTISEIHPSISPETGKWRPEHHWSAMYDMLYAKRCMAILTSRSPRKSDIVIMKGKQWIVDWATGALTRCQPPDYGEIGAEKVGGGRRR